MPELQGPGTDRCACRPSCVVGVAAHVVIQRAARVLPALRDQAPAWQFDDERHLRLVGLPVGPDLDTGSDRPQHRGNGQRARSETALDAIGKDCAHANRHGAGADTAPGTTPTAGAANRKGVIRAFECRLTRANWVAQYPAHFFVRSPMLILNRHHGWFANPIQSGPAMPRDLAQARSRGG
jgi:hypothetical protein